jgi:hypothetical protein
MLTRPTLFETHQYRNGPVRTIVGITYGSDTWYLSETDFNIGTAPVYGLLERITGGGYAADIYQCVVKAARITLQFNNGAFRLGDAEPRLSDIWMGIGRAAVKIYLCSAPNPTAVTDCLKIFDGYTSSGPTVTRGRIILTASDENGAVHKDLPYTLAGDVFSDIPLEKRFVRLPIQYGSFTYEGTLQKKTKYGNGPAPTVTVADGEFCLSDHVCSAVYTMWVAPPGLGGMTCELTNDGTYPNTTLAVANMDEDDSGRGSAEILTTFGSYNIAWAYLYPSAVGADNDATDPLNACIEDETYAVIEASGDDLHVYFLQDFGPGLNADNGIGEITEVHVQWRGETASGASITSGSAQVHSNTGNNNAATTLQSDRYTYDQPGLAPTCLAQMDWITDTEGVFWMLNRGEEDSNGPIEIKISQSGTPDGTNGLANIYGVRIAVKFKYQISAAETCFAELDGLKFGSWIDNAGHDNDFDEGDLIEHPPYIIESILVDHLGVAIADIDHASFDAAYDANLKMKMSLHDGERRNSLEIIREVCRQGLCALYYSPGGKWRLLSWNKSVDDINDTVTTIEAGYIVSPEQLTLARTPWRDLVNHLYLYHGYQYPTGTYALVDEFESSSSQTRYGREIIKDFNARFLDDAGAQYLGDRLVGGNGLWSSDWLTVKFRTRGVTYAHLEIGDYIEFESDALGGRVVDGSINWQSTDFIITKVSYGTGYVDLEAMVTPGRMSFSGAGSTDATAVDYTASTYTEDDPGPPD